MRDRYYGIIGALAVMSISCYGPCRVVYSIFMSEGSMSHVGFKKCRAELKGQGPCD